MKKILILSIVALLSVCPRGYAEDFTTLDGDHYTHATVKRVEPDGIIIADSDGARKLKFKNLPPEIGQKYGYSPESAAKYQEKIKKQELENQQKVAAALEAQVAKQEHLSAIIEKTSQQKAEAIEQANQRQLALEMRADAEAKKPKDNHPLNPWNSLGY